MTFVLELHAHSAASFDSELPIEEMLDRAIAAGITHLAITDHDTIEGALEARHSAPPELDVIVGQEIRTTAGDLIALFVNAPIRSGLAVEETARNIREQGGLVGLPHGFDSYRASVGVPLVRAEQLAWLARQVDYVEVHNGRVRDQRANERAAEFAHAFGLPGVAASDSHWAAEVGQATTHIESLPSSAADLRSALHGSVRLNVRFETVAWPKEGGRLEAGRLRLERLAAVLARKR